jgi:hypothetical protein
MYDNNEKVGIHSKIFIQGFTPLLKWYKKYSFNTYIFKPLYYILSILNTLKVMCFKCKADMLIKLFINKYFKELNYSINIKHKSILS